MLIIKNKILPIGKGYKHLNFFGLILFTKSDYISPIALNHEKIHSRQMLELSIVCHFIVFLLWIMFGISLWWLLLSSCSFYLWYGIEYVLIRAFHKKQNDAYHDVSFEEEAHNNDQELDYLKKRKVFDWIQYVRIKSNKV